MPLHLWYEKTFLHHTSERKELKLPDYTCQHYLSVKWLAPVSFVAFFLSFTTLSINPHEV
jgi:hypothetical protein